MSAPPLPDSFGNYTLGEFNEINAPAAIDWLPQTPGWIVVGLLLVLWLLRIAWKRWQHWYSNRYRREADARLTAISDSPHNPQTAREINQLLKLTALAAWPRPVVAPLSGAQWVNFLNAQCDVAPFDDALSTLLAESVYTSAATDASLCQRLNDAARLWILHHKGPADV